MILSKFSDFYKRFEKFISPIGLIWGFIFTSLTLTRVDMFIENFWIVLHLLIAGGGIIALTYYENRSLGLPREYPRNDGEEKIYFFLTLIIQFAFGGLFSTFFVFYMRSSSFTSSWLFLLILIILLIGNELWKKHYKRLTFQISILFISIYLFLIFLLPVLFHRLGADLFIFSGFLSLFIITLFLLVLKKFSLEKFRKSHNIIRISVVSIFVLMNVMYFTNIIPPIPLALKNAGVYHSIIKNNDGNYKVEAELKVWQDYFNRYPVFHRKIGETVYVFSSIFSPVNFATQIVHQWQYYDEVKKVWIDSSRVILSIVGGRDNGFRTYSMKQNILAGFWRVRVMTPEGKVIGNINFEVKIDDQPRATYPQLLN
jgi:hypothetical protein